jgi:hypothetical protein
MALVFNDRVKETSTTTGTGTLDLGGAFQDFQTFVAGIGNSNETYYNIVLPQTGEFEVGRGVVTDASPDTLSRLEVFTSSNSGNLVDFSAGTKTVFCTLPANKFVPGKFGGTNFSDSILVGHSTTGTLSTASNNTGIGVQALQSLTSGDDNTAVGKNAGVAVNSGIRNSLLGRNAGEAITTGNQNTAFGHHALRANISSDKNTAIGAFSLLSATGAFNIGIGKGAGSNITSGDGNVIIGSDIDAASATGDRQLKIAGHDGSTTTTWISGDSAGALTFADKVVLAANKTIEFGDSGETISGDGTNLNIVSSNSLGIDTANGITLDSGSGGAILKAGGSTTYGTLTSNSGSLSINQTTSDKDIIFTGNDGGSDITPMMIDMSEGGRVGIGTTTPAAPLHINDSGGAFVRLTRTGFSGYLQLSTAGGAGSIAVDGNNTFNIRTNGNVGLSVDGSGNTAIGQGTLTANQGVIVDNITIDGTEIDLSSGDLKIDSAGDITLDADGGDIIFEDASTEIGRFTNDSTDFVIQSSVQDKDIIFKGNDGGSTITAMRLDMSLKGRVSIGSNSFPAERLSVFGENNSSAATLKVKDTDSRGVLIESPYSGFGVGYIGTDGTNSSLGFKVNGTEVGRFSTSGFFGVGTNNPQEEIHINGADPSIRIQDSDGGLATITQAGNNLSFDVPGVIQLDAGGASIEFLDDGLSFLKIENSSSDAHLRSIVQDKDILLRGNDGGSQITALTLDMSEAGDATFNSNIFLGDNKKANFGAGNDLQIYHDGSQSIIEDAGTGQLKILAENTLFFGSTTGSEKYISAVKNGKVDLSHDNAVKLETTSTGIDITGTAVTDGLTVAGNVSVDSGTIKLDGNYPTGTNNVALGDTALDSIGNGGAGHNVAIGHAALTADDTGTGNVGIGAFALTATVTGNYNTAIGQEALKANTSSENNAIGYQSMLTSYSGEKNVALGFWTLKNLGNNDKNVAIGHKAGLNLTGGDNNIIVGHNAQAASATTSNQITLGDANITSLRIPGLQSGASSGDVLTFDGTDIGFATPTGVSAGFAVAMAIAL